MSIDIIKGNIFSSKCHVLVNTVNCVGIMGAGIALEYRLRYPNMFKRYEKICKNKQLSIGQLWIFKKSDPWILNFPTKIHWRYPSKAEYLHKGLKKFVETHESKGINSIAFPLLGADKGKLGQQESLKIMREYLENLQINVEIYQYDSKAEDAFYNAIKENLLTLTVDEIAERINLRKDSIVTLMNVINSEKVTQISQLIKIKGFGIKSIEKVINFANQFQKTNKKTPSSQLDLFNGST